MVQPLAPDLLGAASDHAKIGAGRGPVLGPCCRDSASPRPGPNVRAQNPRFEPGVGVDPRFWQIGVGGRGGPPIPGKSESGIGGGGGPPIVGVCRAAALNGHQNEPMPSFGGCHHPRKAGPKKTQRPPLSVYCRMLMLSARAGLMLQCQLALLEEELARRGGVAEDRATDADRGLFWR